MDEKISKATAAALINSLKGGVVPRVGLEYITVGRRNEIEALLQDVAIIEQGGGAVRFIEGRYGSGKTFLMHALRNHVMEKGFVVTDAELSVNKRFVGNKDQGLNTYRELIRNMAIEACPDCRALMPILDKWIGTVENHVVQYEDLLPGNEEYDLRVAQKIYATTSSLDTKVNGFEFGKVIAMYYKGHRTGDTALQKKAYRWLAGDYKTKTEAKNDLGVTMIINDENWYDFIKLFAGFLKKIGYAGLYVCLDEIESIYEIPSKVGRDYNYTRLLTMYNDALQGKAEYLGIILSVTDEALENTERGIYSFEPLASRIQPEGKNKNLVKLHDMASPIINLMPLNPGEMYVLIEKLTAIHEILYDYTSKLDHDDFIYFLKTEYAKKDSAKDITVREMIREYITMLNLTQQHQNKPKEEILYAE